MVSSSSSSSSSLRMNLPGTRSREFSSWPLESFESMESTLAVQQWIQQIVRHSKNDASLDSQLLDLPDAHACDEGVWKYEHLRQFCMQLNGLAVMLQKECRPEICTQMTATEQWIFLCAAHKTPKECPAIDYTRHTLDGAACLLNSNKYFPSRVSIKESSVAKLGSVCRRVYRIFSHAFFHHRGVFDAFEKETRLCRRFTNFVILYGLMAKDNLIVPIEELQQQEQTAQQQAGQQEQQQQQVGQQQEPREQAESELPQHVQLQEQSAEESGNTTTHELNSSSNVNESEA